MNKKKYTQKEIIDKIFTYGGLIAIGLALAGLLSVIF